MEVNEMVKIFEGRLNCEVKVQSRKCGVKKIEKHELFVRVEREKFMKAVKLLFEIQDYPHFSVISATDFGEKIELLYHFTVDYGKRNQEKLVTLGVSLPKDDLKIETITELIPGAMISEREIHEMMGVEFIGLKDTRHFFLPEDWPDGKYPWRRDETFPEEMTNKMYERWKEVSRDE